MNDSFRNSRQYQDYKRRYMNLARLKIEFRQPIISKYENYSFLEKCKYTLLSLYKDISDEPKITEFMDDMVYEFYCNANRLTDVNDLDLIRFIDDDIDTYNDLVINFWNELAHNQYLSKQSKQWLRQIKERINCINKK